MRTFLKKLRPVTFLFLILIVIHPARAQEIAQTLQEQFQQNGFKNVLVTSLKRQEIYDAPSLAKAQYFANLTFVLFRNTSWAQKLVLAHLKEVARIYNTDSCRILFNRVDIVEADPYKGYVNIDWSSMYPAPPNPVDLQIATQIPVGASRPVVVLMESSSQGYSAYAGVEEKITPQILPMMDTAWITALVNSPTYISRLPAGYDPIAHELAHLFGNVPSHNNLPEPNILHDDFTKINDKILPGQCADFIKSKLVFTGGSL